jgi:L-lactate utilization protein LutC
MTTSRDAFLQRVRQAIADGNRPGAVPALEARGTVGYQGGGADPVKRFGTELAAAGGVLHTVSSFQEAANTVAELAQARQVRKVLLGSGAVIDRLDLQTSLSSRGFEVACVAGLTSEKSSHSFFAADVGISGVEYLIAETGSVVVASAPHEPRSLSLLPPLHIAVAERRQLVPDLFDLFAHYASGEYHETTGQDGAARPSRKLPSCLCLISGPSKTGDIELKLVTGVHGPGEIHVLLVVSEAI